MSLTASIAKASEWFRTPPLPSDQNVHQYSLVEGEGSTHNHLFYIDEDLNELRIKEAPALAPDSSYSIRLSTTDDDGDSFAKAFSLKVIDTTSPSVVITTDTELITEDVTIYFNLSEPSPNFTDVEFSISGGDLGELSGSGTAYSAVFTPHSNSLSDAVISVDAGTGKITRVVINIFNGSCKYGLRSPTVSIETDFDNFGIDDTAEITIKYLNLHHRLLILIQNKLFFHYR